MPEDHFEPHDSSSSLRGLHLMIPLIPSLRRRITTPAGNAHRTIRLEVLALILSCR